MLERFRKLPRWLRWWGGLLLGATLLLEFLFPGQRLGIAFTLATGLGRDSLQQRIDQLETKAIGRAAFSDDDREFLTDFYATLATGGKLSIVIGQTGRLMDHYLARSGSAYELDAEIFTGNAKVQRQAQLLRQRAAKSGCASQRLSSPEFYMPDQSNWDSVFGLYHGTLHATPSLDAAGRCTLRFRAEVPWVWPSYDSLRRKYGDPHAESFPLPSLKALLLGPRHALFVDNGLGQHLEQLGLAKSFLAFAEWSE